MSALYGTLKGQTATNRTIRGSKNSGLTAAAQSYDGSVITELNYKSDELTIKILISDYSDTTGEKVFEGSMQQLKEAFALYNKTCKQRGTK